LRYLSIRYDVGGIATLFGTWAFRGVNLGAAAACCVMLNLGVRVAASSFDLGLLFSFRARLFSFRSR